MLRILIADDHPVVRSGLRTICEKESDLRVVGEIRASDTLRVCRERRWDMVILGLGYSDATGLEIVETLHAEHAHAKTLIFSIHPEDQFAMRALKAGASGYLSHEAPVDEVISAIRRIAAGVRYVRPDFAQRLVLQEVSGDRDPFPHEQLSSRELQVLIMITSGKSLMEIAKALTLSTKTVSTFRSRILGKLKVKTTAELVYYAMKHHLLQVQDSAVGVGQTRH